MSANEALKDEIEALTSIYDSDVLSIAGVSSTGDTAAILTIPNIVYTFNFTFPSSYPDTPPQITGTHHVDASAKKGEGEAASTILRDILGRLFTPGQVCLFDLIEEATPLLTEHHEGQTKGQTDGASQAPEEHSTSGLNRSAAAPSSAPTLSDNRSATFISSPLTAATSLTASRHAAPPNWTVSENLTVNKSTFVARSLGVTTLASATTAISHLLSTDKKVANATHNITAWRIKTPPNAQTGTPEIIVQDSDDDGETAAGGRLLHLMQLMDVWNVVVVVTRWYGGVKLGADRFKCINHVAREALVKGGFVDDEKEKGKGSGSKKGKK